MTNITQESQELFKESLKPLKLNGKEINLVDIAFNTGVINETFRASGNTIRMIDLAVQLIYDGYIVNIQDHYKNGSLKEANRELFDLIIKRLENEHNLNYRKHILYDRMFLKIHLKP